MSKLPHHPTPYFTELVKKTKETAERIIHVDLPRKICDLSEYVEKVQQELLMNEDLPEVNILNEEIEINDKITELNMRLKKELAEYFDIYDVLHMWITYNRAPADNGHPIGEEVQNDVFNSLDAGKDSAVDMFVSLSYYYQERASNILTCRQNMEVTDLVQYVRTLDNSQYDALVPFYHSYLTLCQGFRDLRNAYSTILDKINKNYDKLTNPKGTSTHMQHELMY